MLNSQTIPAWFIGALMITTGVMWLLSLRIKIAALIRAIIPIFAITLIMEGIVYLIAFQIFSLEIEFRGFLSRLIMTVLMISQFFPLAVAYKRSQKS